MGHGLPHQTSRPRSTRHVDAYVSFPAGADGERDLAPNRPPCHLPPCHPVPLRHHLHWKPAGSLSTSATVREPTSVSPRPDIVERVFSVDAEGYANAARYFSFSARNLSISASFRGRVRDNEKK